MSVLGSFQPGVQKHGNRGDLVSRHLDFWLTVGGQTIYIQRIKTMLIQNNKHTKNTQIKKNTDRHTDSHINYILTER